MQEGRILAACQDGAYVIRLVGDVRLTLCTTIDDYLQKMYADENFASVWVDLTQAEGVDSTTLGMLAQLALKVRELFGFRPAIYACDPGILRLLESMAFNRLFDVRDEQCSNPEDIAEIPAIADTEEGVKGRIIEAHRTLMDLSDENRERFQDLMNVLEQG